MDVVLSLYQVILTEIPQLKNIPLPDEVKSLLNNQLNK